TSPPATTSTPSLRPSSAASATAWASMTGTSIIGSGGDLVEGPAAARDAGDGGPVLLDPGAERLRRAAAAGAAEAAAVARQQHVLQLAGGDHLREPAHGRRGVGAVEAADRHDGLARLDDDRGRRHRPVRGEEVLRRALVGLEVADEARADRRAARAAAEAAGRRAARAARLRLCRGRVG